MPMGQTYWQQHGSDKQLSVGTYVYLRGSQTSQRYGELTQPSLLDSAQQGCNSDANSGHAFGLRCQYRRFLRTAD